MRRRSIIERHTFDILQKRHANYCSQCVIELDEIENAAVVVVKQWP